MSLSFLCRDQDKVCGLRWDTLAQILSFSGLYAGSRVLIFDSVLGLIVGSAAYRMRGMGKILAAFAGQQPHFSILDFLNLTPSDLDIITVGKLPIPIVMLRDSRLRQCPQRALFEL